MHQTDDVPSGWEFVATREAAPSLIRAVLELDPGTKLTRSELAAAADVTVKQLYLADTVSELVDLGVLEVVDSEGEPSYTVNPDSEVLAAAAHFEETATSQLAAD
ncbi:MAG: hypothetical protein ABEI98_08255 [Halorhabdus sp.]